MKKQQKVLVVAGARPNFMKIAPLMRAFNKKRNKFNVKLVHTGQHYDYTMSESFFQDLGIPTPQIHLEVGSATHAGQTAKIMTAFEEVVIKEKPELLIVVGDVNSTMACSLVASKLGVKVAHVEAGLRSFDRDMPEEINRLVTDAISDYLFVSEPSGLENLKKEGVPKKKIHFAGNVMIDTLLHSKAKIQKSKVLKNLNLKPGTYGVLTLHRPSNVDSKKSLLEIFEILEWVSSKVRLVYAIHPRTKKMIEKFGLKKKFEQLDNIQVTAPLRYVDFLKLVSESKFMLTDSGGIQEETTILKVPCLTMRENTERPVTLTQGTNLLVGRNAREIKRQVNRVLAGKVKRGKTPRFWDGRAAERIVKVLESH